MECHECGDTMDQSIESELVDMYGGDETFMDVWVCVPCGVATEVCSGAKPSIEEMTREESRERLEEFLND